MNSSFDELLELSQKGDNRAIDMLVGDIYGGLDYSKVILQLILLLYINVHHIEKGKKFQINMAEYYLVLNNSRLAYQLPLLLQVLEKLYQKKRNFKTTDLKTYHSLFYG